MSWWLRMIYVDSGFPSLFPIFWLRVKFLGAWCLFLSMPPLLLGLNTMLLCLPHAIDDYSYTAFYVAQVPLCYFQWNLFVTVCLKCQPDFTVVLSSIRTWTQTEVEIHFWTKLNTKWQWVWKKHFCHPFPPDWPSFHSYRSNIFWD